MCFIHVLELREIFLASSVGIFSPTALVCAHGAWLLFAVAYCCFKTKDEAIRAHCQERKLLFLKKKPIKLYFSLDRFLFAQFL
jgi:hypothetical protein